MFLKTKTDGSLVEVVRVDQLMDPFSSSLVGRMHAGEEMQDSELFDKNELAFPSGESLPICWLKANYQHE